MEEKNEPLLQETVETFPFLQEEKPKEKEEVVKKSGKIKWDRPLITTIIVSALVGYFVINSLYAFYVGFRYYDLRFENKNTVEKNNNENVNIPNQPEEQEVIPDEIPEQMPTQPGNIVEQEPVPASADEVVPEPENLENQVAY